MMPQTRDSIGFQSCTATRTSARTPSSFADEVGALLRIVDAVEVDMNEALAFAADIARRP